MHTLTHRLGAEALGTFWLVLGGCGTAIFAATSTTSTGFPVGVGFVGVALAFGLTVLTMAYAVGHVSGGHFNPAVTLGLAVARRFSWRDVPGYVVAQVVGGLLAGLALMSVAKGRDGFVATGHMAANGFGAHSPAGYSLVAVAVTEVILTAVFVCVILGATDSRAPQGFAPIAIGLALTLIHLVSIPISNTSVNPARSTAVAFFNGDGAPAQLWIFWLAPLVGGAIGGALFHLITGVDRDEMDIDGGAAATTNRAR